LATGDNAGAIPVKVSVNIPELPAAMGVLDGVMVRPVNTDPKGPFTTSDTFQPVIFTLPVLLMVITFEFVVNLVPSIAVIGENFTIKFVPATVATSVPAIDQSKLLVSALAITVKRLPTLEALETLAVCQLEKVAAKTPLPIDTTTIAITTGKNHFARRIT